MNTMPGTLSYFFWHAWDFDFSKVFGCIFLLIAFAVWTRLKPFGKAALFFFAVLLLFLSLASPLDALSDEYLFSAHMLQHFFLLMVVPPMLILSLPESRTRNFLLTPWLTSLEKWLSNPVFAWVFANFILWVWHIPSLYDATLRSEDIHIFEHLTFLVSATIFWWPVLTPVRELQLPLLKGMIYLVLAAFSNMILGILLTFVNEPLYHAYLNPEDRFKILRILRTEYHLDALVDQRLGGILMWVLGSAVFLWIILMQFARWYRDHNDAESLK